MPSEGVHAAPNEPAIAIHGVARSFGNVAALHSISFDVARGELFGVIGPDGAGKSTLLRTLVTLLVPDEGEVRVLGLDAVRDYRALRRRLGYMPGRFALYPDLSVAENLAFHATVFGTTPADGLRIIEPIWRQLAPFADRRADALSGGMKQKLALCCALVHEPELLVLDEPTTGVDAVSRVEFWELLATLRSRGLTIVVSTPYMDEAARCDRVALMQSGNVLRIDTPAALTAGYPLSLLSVSGAERLAMLAVLRTFPHAASVWPFGETMHYSDRRTDIADGPLIAELDAFLASKGLDGVRLAPTAATMEDVFMELAAASERAAGERAA